MKNEGKDGKKIIYLGPTADRFRDLYWSEVEFRMNFKPGMNLSLIPSRNLKIFKHEPRARAESFPEPEPNGKPNDHKLVKITKYSGRSL